MSEPKASLLATKKKQAMNIPCPEEDNNQEHQSKQKRRQQGIEKNVRFVFEFCVFSFFT